MVFFASSELDCLLFIYLFFYNNKLTFVLLKLLYIYLFIEEMNQYQD